MARTRMPPHVWLLCESCGSVGLVRRTGPRTSRKCHFCHGMRRNGVGGMQSVPVLNPYPECSPKADLCHEPGVMRTVEVDRGNNEQMDVFEWNRKVDARLALLSYEDRMKATTYTRDQWKLATKGCLPIGKAATMRYTFDPDRDDAYALDATNAQESIDPAD